MKKKLMALSLSAITVLTMGTTTLAKNNADTDLPYKKVNYSGILGTATTSFRRKDDTSGHYINNQSDITLKVLSLVTGDRNVTGRGKAIVKRGKWRISNYVKEQGYGKCKLKITAAYSGHSGYVKGQWSPDSLGSYTYANP